MKTAEKQAPAKPATYWGVEVTVNGVCKCSTGDTDLGKAIARGITDAVYYQTIYPGARVVIEGISEACARCHNDGEVTIRRPRSWRRVRCPACKGKGAHGAVSPIRFEMPDAANRIRLVQDDGPALASEGGPDHA